MSLGTPYPGLVHGSVGVRGVCGGTQLSPKSLSLQIAGSWAEHLPSTQWAQEGAERGHPCRAANRWSGLGRGGPAPCTLHRGLVGQAGTSMQVVCRPCCAHVSLTRGCTVGAVSHHPGLGVILPWTYCPPEMEALTPPSVSGAAGKVDLVPCQLPLCGVTACSPSPPPGTTHPRP